MLQSTTTSYGQWHQRRLIQLTGRTPHPHEQYPCVNAPTCIVRILCTHVYSINQCNLSGTRTCNCSMLGNHLAYAATHCMRALRVCGNFLLRDRKYFVALESDKTPLLSGKFCHYEESEMESKVNKMLKMQYVQ